MAMAHGIDRRTAMASAGMLLLVGGSAARGAKARTSESQSAAATVSGAAPNVTAIMADYAAATTFAKLPQAVLERAKKVIFDEIACAYFGQRTDAAGMARRYVASVSGPAEARIFGTDVRAGAGFAAMVNGTAGHGEEVDGTHVVGGHPGASIVHAATAMAERQRASGADLITAVVLGYDIGTRLVEACGGKFVVRDRKHLTSDFLYSLGCTAAASRLMKLDPGQYRHALALATFQANGLYALYDEANHISKSFCNGQYAYAGISAALMAHAGLQGNEDIIGSREGVLDAWGDGEHQAAAARALGTDFKILGANFKFFNAGYPIHTAVEAAMTLVQQNGILPDQITEILVGMPKASLRTVDNREMHNISVQDMVTATIVKGGLKLGDLPFPTMLQDSRYKRLRALIVARVDPELEREFPDGRGARVKITTRDGRHFTRRIDNPQGHSLRGEISWDDLAVKWRGSLPGCDVERAVTAARRLETLDRATDLFAALTPALR